MSDRETVDRFLLETVGAVAGYIDQTEAEAAIRECLQVIHKQARALNATDYGARKLSGRCLCAAGCTHHAVVKAPWKPDELARAMAHTAKVLDEVTRLAAFSKGQPDSRPDHGGGNRELLSLLTPEQFRMLEGWITMAQGRG